VAVGDTERELVSIAGTAEWPILTFAGVDSREAALAIGREPIRVAADRLPPVDEETFYVRDLIGCVVVEGERRIGSVVDVESAPANDMLVVETDEGRLLVALVEETVRDVDLDARRITVIEGRAVELPGNR
jgi:16S rRNA processing protein RimM